VSNKATVRGGAINYNYNNPKLTNITFEHNEAQYGPNLASYPVRIGLASDPTSHIEITNVGSGIVIDPAIRLVLLDFDNQAMVLDDASQILIVSQNNTEAAISGSNSAKVTKAVSTFDAIIATAVPGKTDVVLVAS
jgi:hypothetical protein